MAAPSSASSRRITGQSNASDVESQHPPPLPVATVKSKSIHPGERQLKRGDTAFGSAAGGKRTAVVTARSRRANQTASRRYTAVVDLRPARVRLLNKTVHAMMLLFAPLLALVIQAANIVKIYYWQENVVAAVQVVAGNATGTSAAAAAAHQGMAWSHATGVMIGTYAIMTVGAVGYFVLVQRRYFSTLVNQHRCLAGLLVSWAVILAFGDIATGYLMYSDAAVRFLALFIFVLSKLDFKGSLTTAVVMTTAHSAIQFVALLADTDCRAGGAAARACGWTRARAGDHYTPATMGVMVATQYIWALVIAVPCYFVTSQKKHARSLSGELRKEYNRLQKEQKLEEQLVLNILPMSITKHITENGSTIAEAFSDCSILFAKVLGLEAAAPDLHQQIELLNELFSRFDFLTTSSLTHSVEKIKTIDSVYMVGSGLPIPAQDHTHKLARFALLIREDLEIFNSEFGVSLKIKMGMASGRVVAGVIGKTKFTYDVFGDTVNTASRMYSHCPKGKIQLTSTMEIKLRGAGFDVRPHPDGKIEVKGKGLMRTFFLEGYKAPQQRTLLTKAQSLNEIAETIDDVGQQPSVRQMSVDEAPAPAPGVTDARERKASRTSMPTAGVDSEFSVTKASVLEKRRFRGQKENKSQKPVRGLSKPVTRTEKAMTVPARSDFRLAVAESGGVMPPAPPQTSLPEIESKMKPSLAASARDSLPAAHRPSAARILMRRTAIECQPDRVIAHYTPMEDESGPSAFSLVVQQAHQRHVAASTKHRSSSPPRSPSRSKEAAASRARANTYRSDSKKWNTIRERVNSSQGDLARSSTGSQVPSPGIVPSTKSMLDLDDMDGAMSIDGQTGGDDAIDLSATKANLRRWIQRLAHTHADSKWGKIFSSPYKAAWHDLSFTLKSCCSHCEEEDGQDPSESPRSSQAPSRASITAALAGSAATRNRPAGENGQKLYAKELRSFYCLNNEYVAKVVSNGREQLQFYWIIYIGLGGIANSVLKDLLKPATQKLVCNATVAAPKASEMFAYAFYPVVSFPASMLYLIFLSHWGLSVQCLAEIQKHYFVSLTMFIIVLSAVTDITHAVAVDRNYSYLVLLTIMIANVFAQMPHHVSLTFTLLMNIAYLVVFGIAGNNSAASAGDSDFAWALEFWTEWVMPLTIAVVVCDYTCDVHNRKIFLQQRRAQDQKRLAEAQHERTNLLLKKTPLPDSVLLKLKTGADPFMNVDGSLLFADVKGFTTFSSTVSPVRLVKILNQMFIKFDDCARKFGVEKIKTIGDCYVAACYSDYADHALRMINQGFGMQASMIELNKEFDLDIAIRVGIHTGFMRGGIMGKKKIMFDLWGKTVTIANEMEATGVPHRVHISDSTQRSAAKHRLCASLFSFTAHSAEIQEDHDSPVKKRVDTFLVNDLRERTSAPSKRRMSIFGDAAAGAVLSRPDVTDATEGRGSSSSNVKEENVAGTAGKESRAGQLDFPSRGPTVRKLV